MISLFERIQSAEKPVFMALVDPISGETFTANGKPQGLLVVSPLSKSYASQRARIQEKYLGIMSARSSVVGNGKLEWADVEAEVKKEVASMSDDMRAAQRLCVVGWENMLDEKDEPLAFTAENMVKLFHQAPYLDDQLATFLENTANFFTSQKPDSVSGSDTSAGSTSPTSEVSPGEKISSGRPSRHGRRASQNQ